MENRFSKLQLTVSLLLVLFVCITGATYAYFAISASDNSTITGNAATVNMTLAVSRVYPLSSSTNTGVLVPQLSTTLETALKNGCVDGNTNVVCHVYKITIQNQGGTATQVVDGKVAFFGNSAMTVDIATVMPNLKWKLVSTVNETTPSASALGSASVNQASNSLTSFASDVSLATNITRTYYMILWINETGADQPVDVGSSFYGLIQFDASNGTGVTSTFQ